jgi:hypothetical protein
MKVYRLLTLLLFCSLATFLVALHSPGEMSVDSVMALYEAMKGTAIGWGPTFMASVLAWLGGGTIGASLFVALMSLLTYGCFLALILNHNRAEVPAWQIPLAFLLALNPLFMFYVGIIWKDVLQATMVMVAATLVLLSVDRRGVIRGVLIGAAIVITGTLIPIRQQGVLLFIPIVATVVWLTVRNAEHSERLKLAAKTGFIVVASLSCAFLFYFLSSKTVRPQPNGPVSTGILTIQAYDIAGMIAYAPDGDQSVWSETTPETRTQIKNNYSSERIDTIWHIEGVRQYFNSLSAGQYTKIWLGGIEHNPKVYLKSRLAAFSSLLGLNDIKGCVPAFWGIGALSDQVAALSIQNGMNARARLVGHTAMSLYGTPVFRNWFYAALLGIASVVVIVRARGGAKIALLGCIVAAWLYFVSYLPTTIACDFRYLYPVAGLTTVVLIFLLTRVPLLGARNKPPRDHSQWKHSGP